MHLASSPRSFTDVKNSLSGKSGCRSSQLILSSICLGPTQDYQDPSVKRLSWMAIGRGKKQVLINTPSYFSSDDQALNTFTVPAETIPFPNLFHSSHIHQLSDLIIFCQCFTSFIGCRFPPVLNLRWHHTFLHDLLDLLTRIFLLCLISDQKWAADHFPLLHLPFGILSLDISALQIHYQLSVVYSRPSYIKSLFHHSYQ